MHVVLGVERLSVHVEPIAGSSSSEYTWYSIRGAVTTEHALGFTTNLLCRHSFMAFHDRDVTKHVPTAFRRVYTSERTTLGGRSARQSADCCGGLFGMAHVRVTKI